MSEHEIVLLENFFTEELIQASESEAVYGFDREKHARTLSRNMNTLLRSRIFTDVTLISAQNKCVEFHSVLLASRSRKFREYLSLSSVQFCEGSQYLPAVHTDILEALQTYLYLPDQQFAVADWNKLMEFITEWGFEPMVNGHGELSAWLNNLQDMRNTLNLTFLALEVRGVKYAGHSSILAASSPAFCRLLLAQNYSPKSGQNILSLGNRVSPEAVGSLLDYIYGARLAVNAGNVFDLMTLAGELRFLGVSHACASFLSQRIQPATVLGHLKNIQELFNSYADESLKNLISILRTYISKRFAAILLSDEFVIIPCEDDILEYLSLCDRTSFSLDTFIVAMVRWRINGGPDEDARTNRNGSFARIIAIACEMFQPEGLAQARATCDKFKSRRSPPETTSNGNNESSPNDGTVHENNTTQSRNGHTAMGGQESQAVNPPSDIAAAGCIRPVKAGVRKAPPDTGAQTANNDVTSTSQAPPPVPDSSKKSPTTAPAAQQQA